MESPPPPRSPNPTPATPSHASPLLSSAHPSTSPSSPLMPTSSLAPEVQQPSTSPEVVREDQDPKYLVMDDHNSPPYLPKKDSYAPGYAPAPYAPPGGGPEAEKEVDDRRRGRICGMKKRTFWIVLVVAIVVIAGAVGGGVGGALAGGSKSSSAAATTSASTTSPTASSLGAQTTITGTKTSSSSASATATGFTNGCPGSDQTVYTPKNPANNSQPVTIWNTTLSYTILCSTNYASKTSGYNPQITELQRVNNVTTMDDCVTACATYNYQLPNWQNDPDNPNFGVLCSNAVFGIYNKLTSSTCFLQSGDYSNATLISFATDSELTTGVLDWPGIVIGQGS